MTVNHVLAGELNTPEGLKDVIAGRISGIGKNCHRLLSAAAVIGIEFDLKILQAVSEMQEYELLDAIEEAVRLSILEERPSAGQIRYRFTHAFFRRTLYDAMIAPKRSSLHQKIAGALESRYAPHPEEHAAELAEHFSQSTDPSDLTKALKYGKLAAQRAAEIYAFSESARLLNRVLDVQKVLEPENKEVRCQLLLQIGQSLIMAGEPLHVLEVEVPAALHLAESTTNKDLTTRICLLALRSLFFRGYGEAMSTLEAVQWAERVNETARPGTPERAWADFWLGFIKCTRGDQSPGVTLIEKSMERARVLNDRELLGAASVQWIGFGLTPWSASQALKITMDDWRSATTPEWPLAALGAFLSCGQREQAEGVLAYLKDLTARTGRIQSTVTLMTMDATMSYMDGKLEETVEILERILTDTQYADYREGASQHTMWVGLRPLLYMGFKDYIESTLGKTIHKILNSTAHVTPPLLEAFLGNYAKVNEMIDQMLASRKDITSTNDKTQVWYDIAYLEAAVMAGHHPAVEKLLERLSGNTLSLVVLFWPTCIARQLGTAAAFLERYNEARDYYRHVIKICTETGFRPELALTRLQFAELLLIHYPDQEKEALELLTSAVKDLDKMKMRPSLKHAFDLILSIGRKMYRQGELDKLIGLMSIMPDYTSTLLETIRNEKETGIGNSGMPVLFTQPLLLSQREIEVLRLIADGQSNQQIAEKLIISLNTVKTHVSHIFSKLDTTDRLQTVKKARELRLL
jgi:DNA-binding CsgD family transcriptional regulator/tetratricopeptide (TPR) repeat protein